MSSKTTLYRAEHPEWRDRERISDRERLKKYYHENPEHKEIVKQKALARYYRIKEEKLKALENK